VARQIIHHDDVAWLEFWDEDLFHIDLERVPVDRAVEDEGCRDPCEPQTGYEGCGFPVPCGTPARSRSPRAQRPCVRAILVEVEVSSMKMRRPDIPGGSNLAAIVRYPI
jgi:hypothetical protein